MLRNMKIGARLAAGFGVIAVAVVAASGFALVEMRRLSAVTTRLYEHPFTVRRALGKAETSVVKMHRGMKDVAMAPDVETRLRAVRVVDGLEQDVYRELRLVRERFLGDKQEVMNVLDVFAQWKPIRDEVIGLTKDGKAQEAQEITRGKGAAHVVKLETAMAGLVDFAENKARDFIRSADRIGRTAFWWSTLFVAVALGLTLVIGVSVTRSLTRGLAVAVDTADQLSRGRTDVTVEVDSRDEVGQLLESMHSLAATLRDAARQANAVASGDYSADVEPRSDEDELGVSLRTMTGALRDFTTRTTAQDWLKTGIARLNNAMRGDLDVAELARLAISEVATYLDAKVGALYLVGEDSDGPSELALAGSYAYTRRKDLSNRFKLGEGLVGQAALEKKPILLRNVPEEYVRITSGLGDVSPRFISVVPFIHDDEVGGVIEVGLLAEPTETELEYLSQASSGFAINVRTAQGRDRLAHALEQSQRLSAELQTQQEELRVANEELEEQTQLLRQSEEELKVQQEELQVTNEELEERNEALQQQRRDLEESNAQVERARLDTEKKAEELAVASKYKSEFLANMSHELRTPLNSLLILSNSLAENEEGNLTEDQVESAGVIYASGKDLLSLIEEILDLSRIEAGHLEIVTRDVSVQALADSVRTQFQHVAADKGVELRVVVADDAPGRMTTDRKRLEQIVKNLMSNALKFTEQGSVTTMFGRPGDDVDLTASGLTPQQALAISVEDTGIGIPADKQKIIFEAFQQADGSSARKYGGTGLGLSISRELARLLGGEIQLRSTVGAGSTFTLYLPVDQLGSPSPARCSVRPGPAEEGEAAAGDQASSESPSEEAGSGPSAPSVPLKRVPDDRDEIGDGDSTILVVEDDPRFAAILAKHCRTRGFKCLVAPNGEEGIELAGEHLPCAILLDIRLPGVDGWTVLETLKDRTETRHIPVHVITVEDARVEALRKGALGYVAKPVAMADLDRAFVRINDILTREARKVLVVEDDPTLRNGIIKIVGDQDVHAQAAGTAHEAIRQLGAEKWDCMILDLTLPDMTGFELLKALEGMDDIETPPVIVYTGRELTREEDEELRQYAESIIVKGVRSEERLLDEVTLFLHQMVSKLPERKKRTVTNLHDTDSMLKDKRVLIVDDDMRTAFALSKALTARGMSVLKAENGQRALSLLGETEDVDLVLLDIMMPGMDGYETIGRIRGSEHGNRNVPIIALTAKAMKEDREKCLTAGANDYLAKPVDMKRLLSMMRVWLYR